MAKEDKSDVTSESGSVPQPEIPTEPKATRQSSIFSKGRRDLDPKDFSSPVASQFMIDRIERLEVEIEELTDFRKLYYERDADLKVLRDQASLTTLSKNLGSIFLSLGSAGAGIIASVQAPTWPLKMLFVLLLAVAGASFLIRTK